MTAKTIEEIQSLVRNEEEFEKYFKKHGFEDGVGSGSWSPDGRKGLRFYLPDESYIKIKFFDTTKQIFNSKNVEVPGRESWLSYVEVSVMPKGMKGYLFTGWMSQHIWAPAKGRAPAKDLHAESILKLKVMGEQLGIDLNDDSNWDHMFQKHFQKPREKN